MILVTGKGGAAGSWMIRGQQLGIAIGANVKQMATVEDCRDADLIVVVKKAPDDLLEAIRASGKPWIFDMVDCWPQPQGRCDWDQRESVAWLRDILNRLKPDGVVFGTAHMEIDAGWAIPSLVLPHHSWDKYCRHVPVTHEFVSIVGYEGSLNYLGKWTKWILEACEQRGWTFITNVDMRQADIGLSIRDSGGYPARWWKPGTKLSNLQALGLPAICTPEAGSEQMACGEELWVETQADLERAFDSLIDIQVRKKISARMKQSQLPVAQVAQDYLAWLKQFR